MNPLTIGRSGSLCVYQDKLYAFGGKVADNVTVKIVQRYDLVTDTWLEMGLMNKQRSSAYSFTCRFPEEMNL